MRKTDNLPPSCAVVTKSGNLNSLELYGPLRACNGTALPFTVNYRITIIHPFCRHRNNEFEYFTKNTSTICKINTDKYRLNRMVQE